VTVLHRGRTTLTAERAGIDASALVRAMLGDAAPGAATVGATGDVADAALVGATVDAASDAATVGAVVVGASRPRRTRGENVAALVGVSVRADAGRPALDGVDLDVRRGEIAGIAGVDGNGQRELALLLAGRLRPDAGTVRLPAGVGFIPQDRTREGLIGAFDLAENLALALHADARFASGGVMDWDAVRGEAEGVRARFGIVASSASAPADTLSGGNQQRLVVGRELLVATDLLVAENPTRGLDVAAAAFVHAELRRLTSLAEGPGVVLVSSDLDEVLALSDRVLVISRGRLMPVPDDARTRAGVGALMLGGSGGAA
jgi:simple sugar transport system ATP-binding protein